MNRFEGFFKPLMWFMAIMMAAVVAGCGGGGGGGGPAPAAPAAATGVCSGGASCVDLKTAGNYAILAQSGVSTIPTSAVTGDVGLSPAAGTALTGFSETMDASNTFSTSTQVTGKLFAASYAVPTPDTLTVAVADSVAAYNEAAAKPRTPAFPQDPTAGTINATVSPVAPAVYKWTTGVAISGDVVLSGGPDDVWVFQVGGNLTQAANSHVTLTGGAQAKNVFWQVAGNATLGAGAQLVGNIIAQTGINLQAGATVAGRLLAGTAVAMNSSTVVKP